MIKGKKLPFQDDQILEKVKIPSCYLVIKNDEILIWG